MISVIRAAALTTALVLAGCASQPIGQILVATDRNRLEQGGCEQFGSDSSSGDRPVSYVIASRDASGKCSVTSIADAPSLRAQLQQRLKSSDRGLVIFLHGSGQDFEDALVRAGQVARLYQVEVLSLDWPMGSTTRDYGTARANVEKSAERLAPVLREVLRDLAKDPDLRSRSVIVFAHSMGNYALERLAADDTLLRESGMVRRVVVNAADVTVNEHRAWFERISAKDGPALYALINRKDFTLRCATKDGRVWLWELGCGMWVRGRIEGARLGNTAPAGEQLAPGAWYLDVTGLEDMGRKHEYYLEEPRSTAALFRSLLGGYGEAGRPQQPRQPCQRSGRGPEEVM